MKKMFLFFSHNLTSIQIDDAKSNLEIEQFVYLPKKLQNLWSDVPSELESLKEYLSLFRNFLIKNANSEDVVLIQGDFGAVYEMINFSKELGLKAVYSTTKRVIEEETIDNQTIKKSIFEHMRFREYK